MPPTEKAVFVSMKTDVEQEIQEAILADVTDRNGWGHEWDRFGPGTQDDIRAEWRRLLKPIVARIRREARNEALEEAAMAAADAASTWDAKSGGLDTRTGPRCLAIAAAIRSMTEQP